MTSINGELEEGAMRRGRRERRGGGRSGKVREAKRMDRQLRVRVRVRERERG